METSKPDAKVIGNTIAGHRLAGLGGDAGNALPRAEGLPWTLLVLSLGVARRQDELGRFPQK